MLQNYLQEIQRWFREYVDDFRGPDQKLPPLLQLKLEHSLRVAEDARGMARDLGWPDADVNTAEAIGLLHDVGRFSQYAEFKTLSDRHSINHAGRSWEVVDQEIVLSGVSTTDCQRIKDAILYHNNIEIPADVSKDSLPFVRLIRDADKLDIFIVFHEMVTNDMLEDHPELIFGVRLEGTANPELVDMIRARQNVPFSMIKSLTDFKFIQMSWVYDIHYPPAFDRIDQRNIIGKLESLMPPSPEAREVADMARGHVARRGRKPE
jgi:putative nucleotidyltransferase with HDIG domain